MSSIDLWMATDPAFAPDPDQMPPLLTSVCSLSHDSSFETSSCSLDVRSEARDRNSASSRSGHPPGSSIWAANLPVGFENPMMLSFQRLGRLGMERKPDMRRLVKD